MKRIRTQRESINPNLLTCKQSLHCVSTCNGDSMAAPVDLIRDVSILGDFRNFEKLGSIRDPSNDDVRLHAAAVRRLLIDNGAGLLSTSANSRGITLTYPAVDVAPLERASRSPSLGMYAAGGANAFGFYAAGLITEILSRPIGPLNIDFYPEHKPEWAHTTFLRQKVLYLNGVYLNRSQVIKYVANKAAGVHYDQKAADSLTQEAMDAFESLRKHVHISLESGRPCLTYNFEKDNVEPTFRYAPENIDIVLLEFLSIIQTMQKSETICLLLSQIKKDLA